MSRPDDHMDRFTEAWRRWAARPPLLPADAAARQVHCAIEVRRLHPRRPTVLAFAVTVVLAATLAVLLHTHAPSPTTVRPTVGSGVVVMWLDKSTPLYMNLERLRLEKGATP